MLTAEPVTTPATWQQVCRLISAEQTASAPMVLSLGVAVAAGDLPQLSQGTTFPLLWQ